MEAPEDDVQVTHARQLSPGARQPRGVNAPQQPVGIVANFGFGADEVQMIMHALAPYNQQFHHIFHAPPAMPQNLNYQHNAFAPPMPNYVPPPKPSDGFTHSCKDGDEENTVVCPGCDEELEHRKGDNEQATVSKSGKTSRKDREEHPWWVVKECGHVSSPGLPFS